MEKKYIIIRFFFSNSQSMDVIFTPEERSQFLERVKKSWDLTLSCSEYGLNMEHVTHYMEIPK